MSQLRNHFTAYLQVQIRMMFLSWRWAAPLPVMWIIGYMMVNYLEKFQLPAFLRQPNTPPTVNIWDAFFIAFGNAHYMTFVIANLFLILVCDRLPEPIFGQLALFRLRSRSAWWLAKSFTLLLAAAFYIALSAISILSVAAWKLPVRFEWSPWIQDFPANALMPNFAVNDMSLMSTVLWIFLLDVLGFWCLGMLGQLITVLTNKFLYGYFASLLVLLGGYVACGALVNVPDWLKLLPVQRNLILTMYPYPYRDIGLGWSACYWGIGAAILFTFGVILSKRNDFGPQSH